MKDTAFYREVKILLNGVRSYGIEHCREKNPNKLLTDSAEWEEFMLQVHKGFFMTQKNSIFMLQKILKEQKQIKSDLKQARRNRNSDSIKKLNELLDKIKYQEMVVRKAMDSIAWQILKYDLTVMRRLYQGHELIDITDSNLESELRYIDKYLEENPTGFVLISDLTSFVQVGDVVNLSLQKGIQIIELKVGKKNGEIFQIIDTLKEIDCPYYLKTTLENMDKKTREQFVREIKQIGRGLEVSKTINEGVGTDLFTGLSVKIDKNEIELETFQEIINKLLQECDKKGYAISVIDDCLLLGVYEIDKFPSIAFDIWVNTLEIKMPIVDYRRSIYDPLGFPVFLQPFQDKYILELIQGKKIIKMTIDIEKWLKSFEEDGIKWRWLTEKETARINSKFKGKSGIFSLNKRGLELESKEGKKQHIGEGIFSRIFTGFNTPSSMKKILIKAFR